MKIRRLLPAGILALLISMSLAGFAQERSEINGPQLTFEKPNHDYGTVFVDGMPVRVDVNERLSGSCACELKPREREK